MRVRAAPALLAILLLLAEHAVVAAHTHARDELSACRCTPTDPGPARRAAGAHDHDRCALCELAPPISAPAASAPSLPHAGPAPAAHAEAHDAPAHRRERILSPARGPPTPSRFA